MPSPTSKSSGRSIIRNAVVVVGDSHTLIAQCTVYDLSAGGARLRIEGNADIPEKFTLWLASNGAVRRDCRIAWREKNEIGVQFQSSATAERPFADARRLTG